MEKRNNYVYKKYKENSKKILISALVAIFVIVCLFYYFYSLDNYYYAIIVFFLFLGLIFFADKFFAGRFDRNDRTWGRGAKAEADVAGELEKMDGCLVINGLETKNGDIDHVCIAPTGIFTVETKGHYGIISYHDGRLQKNGQDFEKDFIAQARAEKSNLYHLLKDKTGKSYNIIPLLVFANANIDTRFINKPIDDVWICEKGFEKAVIRSGKESLEREEMEKIYNLLTK
jgi:hypothetical protein